MTVSTNHAAGVFSLRYERLVASLALQMKRLPQRKRTILRVSVMAIYALLPFSPPVIGIGVEIMMTPQAVDYRRMSFMPEHNRGSLMLPEFLVIENHHGILAKRGLHESENKRKNREEPCKFHRSFLKPP
jgi:hypothetical protein